MSLKRNVIASYVSQIYVALAGILILPLYIKYMGAEAYGLVGFFAMLQAFFGLLDLGLTPTIGRETARYHGGTMSALQYRQLYRALSVIFIVIALAGCAGLLLLSDLISSRWLKAESLSSAEVKLSVQVMGISVALRWMAGLYRGVITGSERLVWLSGFNSLVATLRFVAVLLSMWVFGFTPFVFFVHQLAVALMEILGLFLKSQHLLPTVKALDRSIGWSFKPVRSILKFALTIAFTSSVWVLVTQVDKLVLSGILSLNEYGHFTLAVLVAGGIMIISGPISSAIMPRMARLHVEGKHEELIHVYRNSTQLISIIAGSAAITLVCCADQLLYAWTGDPKLTAAAAPVLQLYAIGNGLMVVAAFPYYLQYAMGDLRYHLIGNAIMIVVLVPAMILTAKYYGGVGAGYVWVVMNGLYFSIWVAYVLHKLSPGLYVSWVFKDIVLIVFPAFAVGMVAMTLAPELTARSVNIAYVLMVGFVTILVSSICCVVVRKVNNAWGR